MFENITRMFSTDDPDSEDELEADGVQDSSVGLGSEPVDSGEQDVAADRENDDGPDGTEVGVRVDEIEEQLDSTESSLSALRSSQEEMAGSIEEMNDTVRQLVGIYDRLTAEENPFTDDSAATGEGNTVSLMTGAERDATTNSTRGTTNARTPSAETATADVSDDDGVVSFDDLLEQTGDELSEADRSTEDSSPGDEPPSGKPANPTGSDAQDGTSSSTMNEADGGPVLVSVPEGYAGDILVMEWLATLMDSSGPAGALRAINHYESIGWISPEVKDRLVDTIGGPELDIFVDPNQPSEPTADEHAVSHEYIRVLNRLTEI